MHKRAPFTLRPGADQQLIEVGSVAAGDRCERGCLCRSQAGAPSDRVALRLAALLHFRVGINASVMTPKVEC